MSAGRAYSRVDDAEVFRARITRHFTTTDGAEHTSETVRGPYRTAGAARGVATREANYARLYGAGPVTAVVEKASTTWTEVEP